MNSNPLNPAPRPAYDKFYQPEFKHSNLKLLCYKMYEPITRKKTSQLSAKNAFDLSIRELDNLVLNIRAARYIHTHDWLSLFKYPVLFTDKELNKRKKVKYRWKDQADNLFSLKVVLDRKIDAPIYGNNDLHLQCQLADGERLSLRVRHQISLIPHGTCSYAEFSGQFDKRRRLRNEFLFPLSDMFDELEYMDQNDSLDLEKLSEREKHNMVFLLEGYKELLI